MEENKVIDQQEQEESYITLRDVFAALKRGWKLLLIIFLVIFAAGEFYTFAIKKNTYYANSSVTVEYSNDSSSTTSDNINVQTSIQYVVTVNTLITRESVLTKVANTLNDTYKYDYTYTSLSKVITTSYTTNSMIISIKAVTESGEKSQNIVKAVADEISKYSIDGKDDTYKKLKCRINTRDYGEGFYKDGPNRMLYSVIVVLAGLVVGAAVVLVMELASNKFKTKEDIEKLNYPIIGIHQNEKDKKDYENTIDFDTSISSFEPYNRLISNIKLDNVDKPNKVIMVTSTAPEELKTTSISTLAYTAAHNGSKVCIIDLDLRKSRLHKVFGIDKKPGMVEYIKGDAKLEDCIKHCEKANLDVLTSGKSLDNPSAILESQKLADLIKDLKEKYDYVFIDTPPLAAANDAILIAKLVDGVIYNVACNLYNKKMVKESLDTIASNGHVIGLNVTKYEGGKKDSYYYYYYKDYKDTTESK